MRSGGQLQNDDDGHYLQRAITLRHSRPNTLPHTLLHTVWEATAKRRWWPWSHRPSSPSPSLCPRSNLPTAPRTSKTRRASTKISTRHSQNKDIKWKLKTYEPGVRERIEDLDQAHILQRTLNFASLMLLASRQQRLNKLLRLCAYARAITSMLCGGLWP